MAFATNTEYKAYAGITASSWDSVITLLLAKAQATAEIFCDRSPGGFEQASRVQLYDGDGTQVIRLRDAPVASSPALALVSIDDSGTETTVATTDYRVSLETGEIHRLPVAGRTRSVYGEFGGDRFDTVGFCPAFTEGVQNYEVTYTAGWSVSGPDNRPDDLLYGIYRLVDTMMVERGHSGALQQSNIGDVSRVRATPEDRLAFMKEHFGRYRRFVR